MWSGTRAVGHAAVSAIDRTRDNSLRRAALRRRMGERPCSFRFEHRRASTRISGTGNGATPDCPAAPCIRRAGACSLVTAVIPGERREGSGSRGGTVLRAAERSAYCRTSWPPGRRAFSCRSRRASRSHQRSRAWRPPRTRCVARRHPAQRCPLAASPHPRGPNCPYACIDGGGDRRARQRASPRDRSPRRIHAALPSSVTLATITIWRIRTACRRGSTPGPKECSAT
jgi:hypothetical protein